MKSVVIAGFMPTRFGKMIIINPGTDNVYITLEQFNIIKDAKCTKVNYVTEESYTNKAGVVVKYAEGPRNNFAGVALESTEDRFAMAQKYNLTVSL